MLPSIKSLAQVLVISSLTLSALPASATLDFLQPKKLVKQIKTQIAKQKIGADADLVDLNVYQGVGISAKYRIESDPSYQNGYYTRLDEYTIAANINPGDVVEDLDLPISFSIHKDTEITYARQFKSQVESLTALPYTFKQFPISAQRAVSNLKVGDFVAFQADLSMVLSVGKSIVPQPWLDIGVSSSLMISGQFLVQVYRLDNNKVRVKFIAVRGKGASVGASVDFLHTFSIIGIKIVDKLVNGQIHRIVNFSPLSFSAGVNLNDLFMLDYVFDLKDAQAASAYDDIMLNKVAIKDVVVIDPLISKEDLQQKLIIDMSNVEGLFDADKLKPADNRRVDRIFKGTDTVQTDSADFKVGLNMIRYENNSTYSQNKVLSYDANDQSTKFLMDTFSHSESTKLLFNKFGSSSTISANLVLDANDDWTLKDMVGMMVNGNYQMKVVTDVDYVKVQSLVRDLIPASEYAKIDWKTWKYSRLGPANGTFMQQVYFFPAAVSAMPTYAATDISQMFTDYVTQMGGPLQTVAPNYPNPQARDNNATWQERFYLDLVDIGQDFSVAFNPSQSVLKRYNAFVKLREFPIFQERGVGFMLSLLPADQLSQLISYNMVFSAKGEEVISYKFGNTEQQKAYNSLTFIQGVVNNRSNDMRLYTDSDGNFSLTPVTAPPPVPVKWDR